jgi:hypothetical protein
MMQNTVEWMAGRWWVRGRMGCPACPNAFQASLEIPESFLLQIIEEGKRRQREDASRRMTQAEEAELFGKVVKEVRFLVEPGSPADRDAEWLAQWVCELKKRGVLDPHQPLAPADPLAEKDPGRVAEVE